MSSYLTKEVRMGGPNDLKWAAFYSLISNFTASIHDFVPVLLDFLAVDLQVDRMGLFLSFRSGSKVEWVLYGVKGDLKNDRLNQAYPIQGDFSRSPIYLNPTPGIGWDAYVGITTDAGKELVAILAIDDTSASRKFTKEQKKILYYACMLLQAIFTQRHLIDQFRFTDPLTGLLNRRGLDWKIKEINALRQRDNSKIMSLGFIDLDNFGQVNKTFGEPFGDFVLKFFAQNFAQKLRPYDTIIRYGGEEFVVIWDDLGEKMVKRLLNILRFMDRALVDNGKTKLQGIPFSAGVIDVDPEETLAAAIERASQLKNEAKNSGRKKVLYR